MTAEQDHVVIEFPLQPIKRLELMGRLAILDSKIEPLAREAEEIRRKLGLLGIEKGLGEV